jgi:hypothetical protein
MKRPIFKLIVQINSNNEVEIMNNTDDLVEVIIKDKVSKEDIEAADEHNEKSINGINKGYEALDSHLNYGVVESDYEDDLKAGFLGMAESLGYTPK